MRRSEYFGVALIGLLVVAAISVAAGSGRRPAQQERANTSVRVMSEVETSQLASRFPGLQARVQVKADLLERLFPNTAFYKALYHYGRPPSPYLTAISDTSLLSLPYGFNRLLRVYNLGINDKNKVAQAKAFVLMAVGDAPITDPQTGEPSGLDSYPPVIFADANVTEQRMGLYTYDVELKVKIGEQVEEWHFATCGSHQFCFVLRRDAKGRTIDFYTPAPAGALPSRGQLAPQPNMAIGGDAYVEYDTLHPPQPHYYVTVDTNGHQTHHTVVFSLSGFPRESSNVYVAVIDPYRWLQRYILPVQMDSGSGSVPWVPPMNLTGICLVSAGYADPSNPWGTYRP